MSLGPDQRKLVVAFGPTPMLTAFIKSDVNTGTLVVATGEDDVAVYLNGKEYKRRTKRGELRVQTFGNIDVRVFKSGFQPEPNQRVEVKKGEEVKLAFTLKPLPKVAGAPGSQRHTGYSNFPGRPPLGVSARMVYCPRSTLPRAITPSRLGVRASSRNEFSGP